MDDEQWKRLAERKPHGTMYDVGKYIL